jgi:hypothetical protein
MMLTEKIGMEGPVDGIWEGGMEEERVIYLLARNSIKRMVRRQVCGINHCTRGWSSYPGVDGEVIVADGRVCAVFRIPLAAGNDGVG